MKTFKIIAFLFAIISNTFAIKAEAQEKIVALTFDDGPSQTTTKILDILKEYDIKATFFICGKNINKDTRIVMTRAISQGCELGNHARTHSYMDNFSADKIKMEVEYTSHAIRQITGIAPQFFRPPHLVANDVMYGAINLTFIGGLEINDLSPETSAQELAKQVLSRVKPGDIILLHDSDGNNNTVEALKTIIPEMKKQGYEFATTSELFRKANITPNAKNKKIYSNVYE